MNAKPLTNLMDADPPPLTGKALDHVVRQLEKELQRVLGPATEYVLVVAVDGHKAVNLQALTNAPVGIAHHMLRLADGIGFDSLN